MNVPRIVCDLGCIEQGTNDRGGQVKYAGTVRTQDCLERPEEKVCVGQRSSAADTGEGQRVAIPSVGRGYYDNRDDRQPTRMYAGYNEREVGECKKCSKMEYQNKLDFQTDFSEPRRENTEDGRYVYCRDKIKPTNSYYNENRVQRIDSDKKSGSSGSFDGRGLYDDNNRYNTYVSTPNKSVIIYKCPKGCEKYDSGGSGTQDVRQGEGREVYYDRQTTPVSTPTKSNEIIYKCSKGCEKYDSGQDVRQWKDGDLYYERQNTPFSTSTRSYEIIYKCPKGCEKYDSGGSGSQERQEVRQGEGRDVYYDRQTTPVSTPTKNNEIIYKCPKGCEKYDSGQDVRQWKGGDLYYDRQNTLVSTSTKSNDIIYKCPKGCDKDDSDGYGIQDMKQKVRYLNYGSENRPVSPRADVTNFRFPKNCYELDSCHCGNQDVKQNEPYLNISGSDGRNDEEYTERTYNMTKKENSVNESEENIPRNRCSRKCFHYDSGGCDKQEAIISPKCGCEGSIQEVHDTPEINYSRNHSDLNVPPVHSQDNIRQTSESINKTNTLVQKDDQDENEMLFKSDFENPGWRYGNVRDNLGDCVEYCPSCLANQNAIGRGREENPPQFFYESSNSTSNDMENSQNNRPSLVSIRRSRSSNVGGGHQSSSRNSNTARNFVSGQGGNIEVDSTESWNTDFIGYRNQETDINAPAVSRPSIGFISRVRYRGRRCLGCGRALGTEEDRGGCGVRRCGSFKCVERISLRMITDANYPNPTECVTALEITPNDEKPSTFNEDYNSLATEPNTTCEPCVKPQNRGAFRSGRRYTARVQRHDYSSVLNDRALPCESYNRRGTRKANQVGRHAGGCAHTKRPRRICRG